jgi:hypothetical protein
MIMSSMKDALAVSLNTLQPNHVDNYQHREVQAKGPDAFSPSPAVRQHEDTTGDNPDEAEYEINVQHAERVVPVECTVFDVSAVSQQSLCCIALASL